jgi:putative Holliday junction resolvase
MSTHSRSTGRLLGLDYGEVRIGLAISDVERRVASPIGVYQRRSTHEDADYFRRLVYEKNVSAIVVGLPRQTGGEEGYAAEAARQFGQWLAEVTGLRVIYWDERFTTQQADRLMREAGLSGKARKQKLDTVSAQILLQGYLDAGCPAPPASDTTTSQT